MAISNLSSKMPMPDIFPKAWRRTFEGYPYDLVEFRNLEHFKHEVSKLTQKKDDHCDVSYKKALSDLLGGVSNFPEEEQITIRDLVRSNLHKRGLISEEVYEAYRYTTDGTQIGIDVGKYAAGEPDCVISPQRQYIDYFYELYVNISYAHYIKDSTVRENVAKLLATVEELERQHVYIKITLICPNQGCEMGGGSFFSYIPLFSHKDEKSVSVMSSVLNERLLRKFYFAILEDLYQERLVSHYGKAVNLQDSMNIGNLFNEVEFFETVMNQVGA